MKTIRLDASAGGSPEDFCATLLAALGAPSRHGRNLNALLDSLSGGINDLEPPFIVVLEHSSQAEPELADFLAGVVFVFESARDERGADVAISLTWSKSAIHPLPTSY